MAKWKTQHKNKRNKTNNKINNTQKMKIFQPTPKQRKYTQHIKNQNKKHYDILKTTTHTTTKTQKT